MDGMRYYGKLASSRLATTIMEDILDYFSKLQSRKHNNSNHYLMKVTCIKHHQSTTTNIP